MSAHFWDEGREGMELHFERRDSRRVRSGRSCRRWANLASVAHGSWSWRMSVWKCGFRVSRLRLREC